MNFIHARVSSGAVLGALGAGAGLGTGGRYSQVLVALAVVYGGSALATLAIRYPPADETHHGGAAAWRPLVHHPALRALLLICGLSVVVESIVFVWSVIYIRTELDAPVGAALPAAVSTSHPRPSTTERRTVAG